MRRKTIAILFGTGFGLSVIGSIIMFAGGAAIGAAAASCDSSTTYCDPSAGIGGLSVLLILGGLVIAAGGILATISWIAALVKQAQRQQWAWFICTLLFSGICTLLWLIIEPDVPNVQFVPVYQPMQAGYPPAYPTDGPYQPNAFPPTGQPPYYQDPYRPQ
ncbi:MAG TPA: DUF3824 domain-containing protein [Ktedonobacteraceae bacterium]|nr:DUF3824 domain-containing protein [Ktedonobacteraceae bacterium]